MPTFYEPCTKIFKLMWRLVKWKHNKVHGEDSIVTSYINRACKDHQIDFGFLCVKELIIEVEECEEVDSKLNSNNLKKMTETQI
jgi:hypothetical protein